MAERIQDVLGRHRAAQRDAGNYPAARALRRLQIAVARADAKGAFVADSVVSQPASEPSVEAGPIPTPSRLTVASFRDQLHEDLKSRGQEVDLPDPSAAIVEVHNMLIDSGFDVAPMVSVDRKKEEVAYATMERVVRPEYTDGTQMYYATLDGGTTDPLANILERGRTGKEKRIVVTDWTKHAPLRSRFGLSWDEIHSYVSPEVLNTIPHLAKVAAGGGIALRVPTKSEFQSAAQKYPHFGQSNTWEWLYDNTGFVSRLFGGDRGFGGVWAVDGDHPDYRHDGVGFRLQGASPSQKLPR